MAILTISREFGSGGRTVGHAVADSLVYEYLGKGRIFQHIKASGYKWEEWAQELDEHNPTLWERYDWSFRGFGALIQSTILNHALHDNIVIMGRGGSFLLKGVPHALSVRIIAPLETRVARIISRDSIDATTARQLVERTDRERTGFVHALYGKSIDDPSEYDATFDTGKQKIEEIIQAVTSLLEEKERQKTEKSLKNLQAQATAARIKAGLLTDPALFAIMTLDLEYDGTCFVLHGIVHNPREHKRVEDAARRIAENQPLRCELHYRT
jgi:cytidylate kinase